MKSNLSEFGASIASQNYNSRCVCQICNCGNHKCPNNAKYNPQFQISTHKADYLQHPLSHTTPYKDKYKPLETHYQDLKTTHQNDFTPKKQPHTETLRPKQLGQTGQLPFYADTEYKKSYLGFNGDVPQKQKEKYNYVNIPFTAKSIYQQEYTDKPSTQPEQYQQSFVDYRLPFHGNSVYRDEYVERPQVEQYQGSLQGMDLRQSLYPSGQVGDSTYTNSYKRHDRSNYQQNVCPVVELPQRPQNLSPGQNHLTFNAKSGQWL